METLAFPDAMFDAVVSVFSIFFVPDMVKQVTELWRMVRPGGQLAITTWGPRMFEPCSEAWWNAVQAHAPDLYSAFKPWERITTVEAVRHLLISAGVSSPEVEAEAGSQSLLTADDWWTVVMGSGYRWTVDQMSDAAAQRVRDETLRQLRDDKVVCFETNVIYAAARK